MRLYLPKKAIFPYGLGKIVCLAGKSLFQRQTFVLLLNGDRQKDKSG